MTLRIRMALDHWLGRFSVAHPDLRLEALHWAAIDHRTSVLDYWIEGVPAGRWTREIAANPDVRKVDALAESGEGGLYRVVQRMNPVVHLYRRLRLPLRFPLVIGGGVITWEVMAKKSELDAILAFFRERKLEVTISSVRRGLGPAQASVLTPRQRDLLTAAMRTGYFAVPRRITLTELAREVGRSKSSVSEALAHIERRLLEGSLGRAPPPR
ncbi:MAG TPA: helix-turn-helix domain-containing protein [Thermoplasmata archaeon]|nr:helix-turn-helix domain-containing protein [Thermoplasmata archaeon]